MGSIGLATLTATDQNSFSAITPGLYNANITNSEWREGKSGYKYLSIEFTLTSGAIDRRVWASLSLKHPNAKRMAEEHANNLGVAVGIEEFQEPEDILGKALTIEVELDKNDPSRNTVTKYFPLDRSNLPPAAAPTPVADQDEPVW